MPKQIIRIGDTYIDLSSVSCVEHEYGKRVQIYLPHAVIGFENENAREFMAKYKNWLKVLA